MVCEGFYSKDIAGDSVKDSLMKFKVKISPGASANKDEDMPDGTLKIWLTARPHDNEANEALTEYLSDKFRVGKSRISIIKGSKSKNKIVEIL